ncbi:cytoskeletal protein binding protein, partial [Ascosphaera aggregata]
APLPQMTQPMLAQPTGANPAFFSQLGAPQQQPQMQQPMPNQQFIPAMTGFTTQPQPMQPQMTAVMPAPQMPQMTSASGLMAQQPPARPLSAPQNTPQPVSAFGPMTPLQPQMTGASFYGVNMAMQQRQQPPPPPPPFQPQSAFGNAIVAQQTGIPPQQQQQPGFQPQPTGFRSVLQAQPTGFSVPPPPPMPSQPSTLPLTPQKTGPAPPVRFGLQKEKLQPQPTGLRANLAQASKSSFNPFQKLQLKYLVRECAKLTVPIAPSNPFGF